MDNTKTERLGWRSVFSVIKKRNPPALLVEGKALAMNRNLLCYNETDLAVVQSNK